jgi:hypothetical protein
MCNGIRAVWPKGEEKEYMGDGGEVTGHLYMYAGMVGRNIGQIYVRDFRVRVMNFVTFVISEGSSVYEL